MKCIVSKYLHNGSTVLGCFLDASKALDLVDHHKLFGILNKRGLPIPILFYARGIVNRRRKFSGALVCLEGLVFLMVFGKVVFFLPICLLCI